MDGFEIDTVLLLFLFVGLVLNSSYTASCSFGNGNRISVSSCTMIHDDEGSVPSVIASDECLSLLQWPISTTASLRNRTIECQFAQLKGRRKYQEDRITCDLDMNMPSLGKNGLKEVRLGIAAVFDGHGGSEASEMASHLLLNYFHLHYVSKMYKLMVQYKGELTMAESKSLLLQVLKESLLSTIHDIDVKFTQVALENNHICGSTATIILMFDRQILVANVGDSKAFLFSDKIQSGQGAEAMLSAIELTKDHHPDRDDERARIEAAGGSVIVWGVPRVNGVLAMSRSIGDIYLKRYGVIAVPELTGWQPLTTADRYLMVATDGIFESLTAYDVRDLILEWNSHDIQGSSSSLAEYIVNTAYDKGSTDNLSVILIPL
ncbi:hypothetical protein AB3S75_022094 [Citrus x aurantiifolia]